MLNILRIIIFFFLITNTSNANSNVAYLNLDNIISQSLAGKKLINQLENIEKNEISKLSNQRNELTNKKENLFAKKNIISENEFKNEIEKLQKEINNFKKYEISVIDKLKLKKNNSIINFLDKINPIIRDYMEKNSITVLLEKKNIFIAKSNYDITDKLIKIIDQTIINFDIKND